MTAWSVPACPKPALRLPQSRGTQEYKPLWPPEPGVQGVNHGCQMHVKPPSKKLRLWRVRPLTSLERIRGPLDAGLITNLPLRPQPWRSANNSPPERPSFWSIVFCCALGGSWLRTLSLLVPVLGDPRAGAPLGTRARRPRGAPWQQSQNSAHQTLCSSPGFYCPRTGVSLGSF